MNEKIFVDTSFILAYLLIKDSTHIRAIKLINDKDILNNDLYISNYVINEVITLLGQKDNPKRAIKVYKWLKDNFIILNESEICAFNDEVMNTYEKFNKNYKSQKLGFVDCSIITLMKYYKLKNLISFDKEFEKISEINLIN